MNERSRGPEIDLLTQPLHICVDDIGERIKVLVPYVFSDLGPTQNLSLVEHQKFEQRVFFSCQPDGAAAAGSRVIDCIERKIRHLEQVTAKLPVPSQQSSYTSEQ